MEHTELKSNSTAELMRFVESHLPSLDRFRLEVAKDREGALIAELISTEPEPKPQNA
jgi:hypothetical protein